jgi:GMP synthase (glutamine-hydrolysing)
VGETAWGVQFHPEFDADVMRGYIDMLAEGLRKEGADPAALRERVAATDTAAGLLGRFARIVEAHEGV